MTRLRAHDEANSDRSYVLVVLVVGLGAALRFTGLNRQSYWYDEAFSWAASAQPFDAMIATLVRDFVHPPLHYLILHGWLALPFWTDQAAAGRLLVALFGIATLPALYWLGCEIFGRRTALLATTFLALSQLGIAYSQEVRPYSQLMLFSVLNAACFVHAVKHRSAGALCGAVVFAAASIATHYYAVLVCAALLVWYFAYERSALPKAWVAAAIMAVAFAQLPWLLSGVVDAALAARPAKPNAVPSYFGVGPGTLFENLAAFGNARIFNSVAPATRWPRIALATAMFSAPIIWLFRPDWRLPRWTGVAAIAASLVLVLALAVLQPGRLPLTVGFAIGLVIVSPLLGHIPPRARAGDGDSMTVLLLLLVVLPIAVPLLGAIFKVQYDIRYVLTALPAFYLLAAHAILQIDRPWLRRGWVIAAMLALLPGVHVALTAPDKEDYRGAFGAIHAGLRDGDCVVMPFKPGTLAQWRLYGYDDFVLPIVEAGDTMSCGTVWLLEYQRIGAQYRLGAVIEAAMRAERPALSEQQFHWLKLTRFGPLKPATGSEYTP